MRRAPILLAALIALAAAPAAQATTRTYTFFSPAHTIPGYEAQQQVDFAIPHPDVDGYVTGLVADVVAEPFARAHSLPIRKVMLHHIVFSKLGAADPTCPGSPTQRFYAEGEEHTRFALPTGYGYPTSAGDTWVMLWMLMNHAPRDLTVYVRYRVTYVTGETLTPVTPYWLDVNNCLPDPIYDVPGVGPGSTSTRSTTFTMPESGRIVAAGGHVHGGGLRLDVRDETCSDRLLYSSRPVWGSRRHPYYTVRPILHEPGPIHMSQFTSTAGIPVAAGDTLRLDAVYDNRRPHSRVMGITLLMVAHDAAVTGCETPGALDWTKAPSGRHRPPAFTVPLFYQPGGRFRHTTTVTAPGKYFSPSKVVLRQGATLTWDIGTTDGQHTITWASGPARAGAFSSGPFGLLPGAFTLQHTFDVPGTYSFFCSLHPATMVEVVRVVPTSH